MFSDLNPSTGACTLTLADNNEILSLDRLVWTHYVPKEFYMQAQEVDILSTSAHNS